MTGIASFEILAQPIVPGVPNVPYVQQGSFFQITNIVANPLIVNLYYYPSPAFVASSGAVSLFVNYIDNNGTVTQIPAATFIAQGGIFNISIPQLSTFIFGVQYIITPGQSTQLVGSTPQDSLATRGIIFLDASADPVISPVPTIRQVFNNYDTAGNLLDISESAYAVPYEKYPSSTNLRK
jgi:hypothetical protein